MIRARLPRRPGKPRPFGLGPAGGSGIAATVATAIAIGVVVYTGGEPDPGTANLWVDTNGGTCTRQATPAEYVDAAACSSLNAAYQAASDSGGDTIKVKGGTYGTQSLLEDTGKTGPTHTTITEATGETVIIGDPGDETNCIDIDGADYLTISGVETDYTTVEPLDIPEVADNHQCSVAIGRNGTNNITLDGVDVGGVFIAADDTRVLNSDLGPSLDVQALKIDSPTGNRATNPSVNVEIDGNAVHDIIRSSRPDSHTECFALWQGQNVTVTDNTFNNCQVFHIWVVGESDQTGSAGKITTTIERNTFTQTDGAIPISNAVKLGDHGGEIEVDFDDNDILTDDMLVEQGYLGTGDGVATITNNTVVENITRSGAGDCMDGVDDTVSGFHIVCEDNVIG